jgi:hypothetical protein
LFWDIQQVNVKVPDVEEAANLYKVLDALPDEEEGVKPNRQVPETGHSARALRNYNFM